METTRESLSEALSFPRQRSLSEAPATFYTIVGGNDTYWRVKAPAEAIGANLCLLPEGEAEDLISWPNQSEIFPWSITMTLLSGKQRTIRTPLGWKQTRGRKVPYRFTKLEAHFPKHEGVAVFTRPMFPQAVIAQQMREQGVRTIAETDDNYFAKPNQTLYLRESKFDDDARTAAAKALAQQDAVIFSTEWLRDRHYKEFRARFGKKGLPDLFVCHNNIPIEAWPERIPGDGRVRVGFMGSTSHVWDVNIAYASFKLAKQLGATTTMIGYNPGDPDPGIPDFITDEDGQRHEIHSQKAILNREKWAASIDTHIPWVKSEEYHRAALPLDIGLCPLVYDDFTAGRSDVKAIEYTISGAAVVCTNNPVYNWFWKHEENCLMANSYEEMALATARLIKDTKLRYELVTAAQEKISAERGLPQLRAEWEDALNG